MKIIKSGLILFVCLSGQLVFGMERIKYKQFVEQALACEESVKKELLDLTFEILSADLDDEIRCCEERRKICTIYAARDTIIDGIFEKKCWKPGEVAALFNSLFVEKYPGETNKETLERLGFKEID